MVTIGSIKVKILRNTAIKKWMPDSGTYSVTIKFTVHAS